MLKYRTEWHVAMMDTSVWSENLPTKGSCGIEQKILDIFALIELK